MRNAGLDEAQAGIKIAGRNINNLRYADNTILMTESKEPLDESERGAWKAGLKLNIQKTNIIASSSNISWEIDGETMETVTDFILGGLKITVDGDCSHERAAHLKTVVFFCKNVYWILTRGLKYIHFEFAILRM